LLRMPPSSPDPDEEEDGRFFLAWQDGEWVVRGRRGVDGEVEALVLLCLLSEEAKHLSCRKKHREGKVPAGGVPV